VADALVIFKPDAAYRLAVRAALWSWLAQEREWKIHGLHWFKPPADLVEGHYDFLRARPFFPWLVDFMTALPVLVGRLEAEPSAIEAMRYELGETNIQNARPGSLRERYGIHGGINCLHLSDSPETGTHELKLWAPHVTLDGIDVDLETVSHHPDYTFHLRSLATQVAAGIHAELASQEIKRLLKEETDLASAEFAAFTRIVLGAFSA
jgi:nucleoside-diphosphate kinase